jgi:hypothetical protein
MTRVALGLLVILLASLGALWAVLRASARPMPSPDPLGSVEEDWAAIVADLRKEQA